MTQAKLDAAKVLLEAGSTASVVADTIGVSRATLYRHVSTAHRYVGEGFSSLAQRPGDLPRVRVD